MPGMMDTILNLGINDSRSGRPGKKDRQRTISPGIRIDAFLQMYGDVVMGVQAAPR